MLWVLHYNRWQEDRFISVVIPQTSCCFSAILLYSTKLYIGTTTSRSSALSINTLLIFDMQLVNDALFLNAKNLFFMSIIPLPFVFVRVTVLLTTIYLSLKSHKPDHSIDVLNLICLLGLYLSSALTD